MPSQPSPRPAPGTTRASLIRLEIQTDDGLLRARLAVPEGGMRLAELAFNAMPLAERLVGLAVGREQKAGRPVTCGPACGVCCRQLVPLSPPEAFMIADLIASMPPPRRDPLLDRFREAARRLHEGGFKQRLLRPPDSEEQTRQLGRAYFDLGLPCPFLLEESCSMYPYRPSICREYLVTSPPDCCADPFGGLVARVSVPVRLSKALARLTAELAGGEPTLIPLTLAPLWVAEHPELRIRQWPARPSLERLLELMSEK